jgi:M6 family metalloprotease-like protein
MKIILLFFFYILISQISWANSCKNNTDTKASPCISFGVPACPEPILYKQPDGSIIEIFLKGDAVLNWIQDSEGYTIIKNEDGYYEYAINDSFGNLVTSGVRVKEIKEDLKSSLSTPTNIQKNLFYSTEQVEQKFQQYYESHYSESSTNNSFPLFPTTGKQKLLVILANFSDTQTTYTKEDFERQMNEAGYNGTGSIHDYFMECSYGQLDLDIHVIGWIQLPGNKEYYKNTFRFTIDVINAADTIVDFSEFDNNADGVVDCVAIIHQGMGYETSGDQNDFWSGFSNLVSGNLYDNVKIAPRIITPEILNKDNDIITIGTFCHEFGHAMGAPDFYDTNNQIDGYFQGTGNWDLQAGGNWNGYPKGSVPSHPNIFTKYYYYHWLTPIEITEKASLLLRNSAEYPDAFFYQTETPNEFFFLENRQKIGFDSKTPGNGLLIYHVDADWINNHIGKANTTEHQGLYIKDAGRDNDINNSNTPYPTIGNDKFTDTTFPNSKSWSGENTNIPITNIKLENGIISFDALMPECEDYHVVLYDTICEGDEYTAGGQTYYEKDTISLKHTTINGCDSTVVINLEVIKLPNAGIKVENNNNCYGDLTRLTATGGDFSYLWNTGETTQSIESFYGGVYYVTLSNSNCISSSIAVVVSKDILPDKPSIAVNSNELTSSSPVGNQWFLNKIEIKGATEQTYTIKETGNYSVQVSNENGCISEMSDDVNVSFTSVNGIKYQVQVYPNPTTGLMTISGLPYNEPTNVSVYNLLGEKVLEKSITGTSTIIDMTAQNKGVYFVRFEGDTNNGIKILKQ